MHKSLLTVAVTLSNKACPHTHRPQPAKPPYATTVPINFKFSSTHCGVFHPCFQQVKLQHTNDSVLQLNQRAYTFLEKMQEVGQPSEGLSKIHL